MKLREMVKKNNKKSIPLLVFLLLFVIEIFAIWLFYTEISHFVGWFIGIVVFLLTITHDIPRLFINREDL